MKNWKRNAVTAVVLMFVCAGVYLNWSYNQQNTTNLADTLDAQKVMGENLVLSNDGAVTETGGEEGGRIVAAGTPEEIASSPESLTGKFLRPLL